MADKALTAPDGSSVPVPANVGAVYAPSMDMLDPARYAVTKQGQMEGITQPLYSGQAYPAAGTAGSLQFFQNQPVGAVTSEDTNMTLQGQLPAPQRFLIQGIGVEYIPGNAAGRFGAQSANSNLNDYFAVMRRGLLTLSISSKEYFRCSTMMQLPVRSHVNGVATTSDQTTAGAAMQSMTTVGFSDGDTFKPRPLLIDSSMNFNVAISYPGGAVAIPSADAAARIFVWLYGTLYRPVQ